MILPQIRDKRFITIRRGGVLTDADHHQLALWAAECAEHVLPYFEETRPKEDRPRLAVLAARAWAAGGITVRQALDAAGASNAAARNLVAPAKFAALAAGQAAAVAHVAAHELGAAAYAIRAAMAAAPEDQREAVRQTEWEWQRSRLPERLRALVLDDQRLRNDICWNVFTV